MVTSFDLHDRSQCLLFDRMCLYTLNDVIYTVWYIFTFDIIWNPAYEICDCTKKCRLMAILFTKCSFDDLNHLVSLCLVFFIQKSSLFCKVCSITFGFIPWFFICSIKINLACFVKLCPGSWKCWLNGIDCSLCASCLWLFNRIFHGNSD